MKLRVALVMTLAMVMGAIFVLATTTDATAAEADETTQIFGVPALPGDLTAEEILQTPQTTFFAPGLDEIPPETEPLPFSMDRGIYHFMALWDSPSAVETEHFVAFVSDDGQPYIGMLYMYSQPLQDAETGLWGGLFSGGFMQMPVLNLDSVPMVLHERDLAETATISRMYLNFAHGDWDSAELVPERQVFEIVGLNDSRIVELDRAHPPLIRAWEDIWFGFFEGFVEFDEPFVIALERLEFLAYNGGMD